MLKKNKKILICGSLAYDRVMLFNDLFKNHILPDQIHILNVCFLVEKIRREFGGCGGNVAYNLKLLGENSMIMATVGEDFTDYANWLNRCGLCCDYISVIKKNCTAHAFIVTDMDDNQITAFHPGAMNQSSINHVYDVKDISIGLISPDGVAGMIEHARQFFERSIPFIFDPGQQLSLFNKDDLCLFAEQASWMVFNDYEWQIFMLRSGLKIDEIVERNKVVIITKGKFGSVIHTKHETHTIPVASVSVIKDPTGCGDAYRAGIIYGLVHELDWETTGRIASLMGAINIEHFGSQNHTFTKEDFLSRFQTTFHRLL